MVSEGIAVVGNVNVDLIVSTASELPPPGAEWRVGSVELRTGGAAANTALALSALGTPPCIAGCVGDDRLGRLLLDDLSRAGVEGIVVAPDTPTGVSVAFEAPDRDRSFLTALGALATFDPSLVPEACLERRFVLLCGYFLSPRMRGAAAQRLLGTARERGASTLLDVGWDPEGWPAPTRHEVIALLPLVDVFLPNEAEAIALTGATEPAEAARRLQRASAGWVVVKLGAQGCIAAGPDDTELAVAAPEVDVLDTTGAGDAFNAGVLHALARGDDWPEALRLATRVASTVISRPSADRYPRIEELV
jgi:argininosuccinate lyase